ncbi:uncharacterized protein LOC141853430 [Brevipalpus obovatus]|uniref:uncharacterized protein LOC141853430 n=1 Tax=Brevipalpus obovatus TaxID=246614 RepID=UPI003D9DBBAB
MNLSNVLIFSVAFLLNILYSKVRVLCLETAYIKVPKVAYIGQSVELKCSINDRKNNPLVSIKWYKDSSEFYRWTFTAVSDKILLLIPALGVRINEERSIAGTVFLENITRETQGIYRCEVTLEKNFATWEKEAKMEVIEKPPPVSWTSRIHNSASLQLVNHFFSHNYLLTLCFVLNFFRILQSY